MSLVLDLGIHQSNTPVLLLPFASKDCAVLELVLFIVNLTFHLHYLANVEVP